MTNNNIDTILPGDGAQPRPGPFLAKVIGHLDPSYMGMLEVELLRPVGNDGSAGQLHQVKMMSPFWGSTSADYISKDPNNYDNTQKSYGMWFVPPDPGTTVMVFFVDGDPKRGYWFGCIPDESINFMVPGIAATEYVVEGGGRLPVAEINKSVQETITDATKIKKPKHKFADVLEKQGLLKDDIRGITTSSCRREVPSSVFGISTPGPIDKAGKQGFIGKIESKVRAYVSRLGGSTFVMDDGDDKFLRKTSAGEGPPAYASIGAGETDGEKEIPHNELVRIRTRTGHQILMHNSEDLIYITNSRGTAWIELTSNGKIDIYAQDSVSIHTENDFNITATRDINFTAGGDINFNAQINFNATAGANYELKAGADGKLTVGGSSNIKAGGNHVETAAEIHMNGPEAATAIAAPKAARIPKTEPWAGHENLDPLEATPEKTKAVEEPVEPTGGEYFEKYTTTTDPFNKIVSATSVTNSTGNA